MSLTRDQFESLKDKILKNRQSGEHFFIGLGGERSQFVRINSAKIRQIGTVEDANLEITLVLEDQSGGLRRATHSCTLTGLSWKDWEEVEFVLKRLRSEVPALPLDLYAELPKDFGSSANETRGEILSIDRAPDALVSKFHGNLDVAGIYAGGSMIRGMANSAGLTHWFSTDTFSFDYSIYTPNQRAIKGTYAGKKWDQAQFESGLETSRSRLSIMEKPAKRIERGTYRTYLAPAAVNDLIQMFTWGCIGEASIRQGDSPLRHVLSGERKFSDKFNFAEDFRGGEVPRFNSLGEIAPDFLPLFENGQLKNTLVSSRTAKEYGLKSNGASSTEGLRSPVVAAGTLAEKEILKRLDTGLYLSNLHYLNWSDQVGGRITGMTRYACFWVEKGQIIAPIENMRWDESIFNFFGDSLEEFTSHRSYQPDVHTYGQRNLGGALMPGALLSKMTFTI